MSSNKESSMEQSKVTNARKDENNSNDADPIMKILNMMNTIMNDITGMKQYMSSLDEKTNNMHSALQLSFEETKKQVFKCTDQYTNLHSEYSKQIIKLDNNLDIKFSDLEEKFKKLADDNRSYFNALYQIIEESKKELNAKIDELKKDNFSNEEVRKSKDFNEPVKKNPNW